MSKNSNTKTLWRELRPFLIPFDRMASQFYIFELPIDALGHCVDAFCARVKNPTVDKISLDLARKGTFIANINSEYASVIAGTINENPIHVWFRADRAALDAEIYFFSDELFPECNSEEEHFETFKTLVEICDSFRAINPNSECAFSASEGGDPRSQREEDWVMFW